VLSIVIGPVNTNSFQRLYVDDCNDDGMLIIIRSSETTAPTFELCIRIFYSKLRAESPKRMCL